MNVSQSALAIGASVLWGLAVWQTLCAIAMPDPRERWPAAAYVMAALLLTFTFAGYQP